MESAIQRIGHVCGEEEMRVHKGKGGMELYSTRDAAGQMVIGVTGWMAMVSNARDGFGVGDEGLPFCI